MASDTTRAIFPTTRTILWSPRRADVSRAPQARARFCITQRALARLEHDVAAPGHPGLGFLLGSHHHCPRLDVDYGVADMIVSWPRSIDRTELALPTTESLRDAAATVVATASRELLGWFQVCGHMRTALSRARARTHHELLGEPWQRTLVLMPGATGPTGCFYHATSAEAGFPTEFYEVTDVGAEDGRARKRSCVTWSATYEAAEPVILLHESVRRALASSAEARWSTTAASVRTAAAAAGAAVVAPPPELTLVASPYRSEAPSRPPSIPTSIAPSIAPSIQPSIPPSIPFPLYVPPRDDAAPMSLSRRWWHRLGAHRSTA